MTAWLVAALRALQEASATIAAGRSGTRLDPHAPGEIGQMAVTFNRMAGALDEAADVRKRWITDLATLHDLEAGEATIDLVRTDLADLVRTGAAAVRTRFGEREATLTVTAPDEGAWATADPVRTGQVLENLLDNALRFTPSGGVVGVEVSERNDVVRVEMRDTWPGAP